MATRDESWPERQAAIQEILARRAIRTQGQLLDALRGRGFDVTQPSVSRDLADLKAVKVDGRYRIPRPLAAAGVDGDLREAAEAIRETRLAGPNLMVVRTRPGRASIVGLAFDRSGLPGMVGCIAGDDTVFVATEGRQAQAALQGLLGRLAREASGA
jgi:transcriptional regulator of arginine metabolism